MTAQLPLWQMAVDLSLVAAVMTMAIRWMKGSRAQALLPQTLELEAALRNLIAEAEVAGRHLNDQLLRRETNIQKYLAELEESEKRMTRSVVEGEEVAKRIEGISAAAQTRLDELMASREGRPQSTRTSQSEASVSQPQARSTAQAPDAGMRAGRPAAPQTARAESAAAAQGAASRNAAKPPARAAQPYGDQSKRSTTELQKVYAAAEKMIRDGVNVEQVSATTRIPLEGVKLLSQMIEVERTEEAESAERESRMASGDPRLGALGVTRRQPNA